jgi:hypothetical protein
MNDQSQLSTHWPFEDTENTAVVCMRSIMDSNAAVLVASRDCVGWGFTDGSDPTADKAIVVALGTVVKLDESLRELADLPMNWMASRTTKDSPWQWEPLPADWDDDVEVGGEG